MYKYILKRLAMLIPVIIGASLLVFVMMDMAPGNVLDTMGGEYSEETKAEMAHEMGLDRSVFYRYAKYMGDMLHGDLGTSYVYKEPVWKLYINRLPATVLLSIASLLIAIPISLPLGIKAAEKHGSVLDNFSMIFALIGTSIPNFWLGVMLMIVFSLKLGWLPSGGNEGITSVILPAITLSASIIGSLTRTTRSCMLDVIRADYLRTARSKGVPEKTVIKKHAQRNAMIPIITVIGSQLSRVLGGSMVIETVFTWPGVGRLLFEAIKQRDTTTATGCIIMTAVLVSIVQLAVDLIYAYVDPRLRAQYTSKKKGAAAL